MRGIAILQKAIKKLQMSSTQLTPVHADLCQLCLLAKNFKPALEFLDIDMVSIGQEVKPVIVLNVVMQIILNYV